MNSLEYIDLLIKSREEEVNRYTKVKNNLYFNESKAYYEKEMIGRINEQIQQLQQIKTELEAWEEIKKYLVLNEGCIYEDSYYEYLTLQNDCIDETESEEQGVSLEIIKKALEVK